jgi:diadenosine tetraphosphate (Ap4A) HIT family hydrolase
VGVFVGNWPWSSPSGWQRLRRGVDCPLCDPGALADVVVRLPSTLVRVPRSACLPGYACVIHARHAVELHDLGSEEAAAFMRDVCSVSHVVERVTGAAKVNLLSLGNLVPHLHVHVCPRRPGDRFDGLPLDPGHVAEVYRAGEHERFVAELLHGLRG